MEKTMPVFCFGQLEQRITDCRDVHSLRDRHLVPLASSRKETRRRHYREDICILRVKKINRKDTLLLQPHPHKGHTERRELNAIENLNIFPGAHRCCGRVSRVLVYIQLTYSSTPKVFPNLLRVTNALAHIHDRGSPSPRQSRRRLER